MPKVYVCLCTTVVSAWLAFPAFAAVPIVVESRVASGADDAEESSTGTIYLDSSDLELVFDGTNQVVGLRFDGVSVPSGANITSAWIQFTVDETFSPATSLVIWGESADDAAPFNSTLRGISSRPRTVASHSWAPPGWTAEGLAGEAQRTGDLSAIVQEIVDRPGWVAGQAMAMVITGTGERVAESYEGSSGRAPLLHIEYTPAGGSPPPASGSAESRVSSRSDDAEESAAGIVSTASTDLELVEDFGIQTVGMRFRSLAIPPGAAITTAWIQFQVDEAGSGSANLLVQGEASDQAAAFSATAANISSRARTVASVLWAPEPWPSIGQAGPAQRTPDLSEIIQEIVNRPGWASGDPLAILVSGAGKRVAEAYDGSAAGAPLLHVEFTAGAGGGPAAADQVHWTLIGQNAVAFSWRGPESESVLSYGTIPGLLTSTVQAHTPSPLPTSSAGPFWEAHLTGLAENTLYYYRIGTGPERSFRAAPPGGTSRFWIAHQADVGGPPSIHPEALITQQQIAADHPVLSGDDRPRFVLVGGNLSYGDQAGPRAVDDHFNAVMAWSRTAAYMPAWGGRESGSGLDDRANYEGRFDLPNAQDSPGAPTSGGTGEEWMWFDYGNARFISYPEPFPGALADWSARADAIMAEAQADPRIAFIVTWGSRPAWSSGADHAGEAELRQYLRDLRARYPKFALNLAGRSRHYERTIPSQTDGLMHIVAAGGGAPVGGLIAPQPIWSAVRVNHLHHLRMRFLPDRIEGFAICGPAGAGATDTCAQNSVIDSWTVLAGGSAPVNLPPSGTIDSPAGPVTVAAGQAVTFQGTATDPDGNLPLRYAWDFGGGAAQRTVEDPGLVSFAAPGVYTVKLTVSDALGLADPTPDSRIVTVVPAGSGRTFHVSPSGSDSSNGSVVSPFRTIAHGLTRLSPGDTLLLRGGLYLERPTVSVSGTAASPITIASYPGETAVIDSGGRDFRSPGNSDWELVDAGLGEYRSVRSFGGGTVYGYVTGIAGYRNGRVGLVPYTSASAFRSTSDQYVDGLTPFYVGPGTYRDSDGRLHIRLAKTAEMRLVEARYGTVFPEENADPSQYGMVISSASTTLTVRGSYLVFRGLTIHQAQRSVSLAGGVHDLKFEGVTVWGGDNSIAVDGSGVHSVTIERSRLYGDVPQWIAWSDAKDAPAPADLMRGCSLDLAQGARDVRVSWSHLRGGHDGIGVNDSEDGITVDHSRIENFADDCFELEGTTSVGRISIFENFIGNCLVAIAPGQDTPVFDGPLLVYRNVIALLHNPFVNRLPGINGWNGGGKYGYEYMFKHGTGSSYSTRNVHYYHNTLVMLNSAGKGINMTPKYADDARLVNNLVVMVNGTAQGSYRSAPGMVWNGDLYWKVNTVDSASLLAGHATVASFSSATGYERNGLGAVSRRGTDPLFATWRPGFVSRSVPVWELLPGWEVAGPADFMLGPGSPAIGAGFVIPAHPVLGTLPDTRSSRDIGAIPFNTPASEYEVFPFVPGGP